MIKKNRGDRFRRAFDFAHEHIIIIIIVIVVMAGLASTIAIVRGDASPKKGEAAEATTTYETMDTVYLAMDEVASLEPLGSQDRDVYYISQLIYSSLFKLGDDLSLKKDLVKSYTVHTSEGAVSLTLRGDAKFSDGSSLTASDVRYTVLQIQRLGADSPYYHDVSKIQSVSVTGSKSLTITFESPSDAALDNLIFPVVDESSYDSGSNRNLGSGPYCYSSYDHMKCLKLKPNKEYYGQKASNSLQLRIVPDKSKTTGLMTMDAVTAYVNTNLDADVDAEDKNLKSVKIPSGEAEYLAFNFNKKAMASSQVRRAIAKAVDVQSVISDNYGGSAIASDSIYFPGFLGTENKGDAYELDQAGALKLLKEAGYEDKNEDGILEDEKGKSLSLTILVNSGNSRRTDTARGIAADLEAIGIRARVSALSWDAYRSAISQGDFDIYLGGYSFDKKYDLRSLFKASNPLGYKNSQVRAYTRQLETCISAKKQKSVYEALKAQLTEDLPYYCLCYKAYSFVTVAHFEGETIPTFFDRFRGCGSWTWEKTVTIEPEEAPADDAEGDEEN